MGLDDGLDDREPETGALDRLLGRVAARKKRSKSWFTSAGDIPMPSSETSITIASAS